MNHKKKYLKNIISLKNKTSEGTISQQTEN